MLQEHSEAGNRLLPHSDSAESMDERLSSCKEASSRASSCWGVVQEGFTEGIVSVKEAAVYISKKDNRCVAGNFLLCFALRFRETLVCGFTLLDCMCLLLRHNYI